VLCFQIVFPFVGSLVLGVRSALSLKRSMNVELHNLMISPHGSFGSHQSDQSVVESAGNVLHEQHDLATAHRNAQATQNSEVAEDFPEELQGPKMRSGLPEIDQPEPQQPEPESGPEPEPVHDSG
jgi:hypothetical protein